MVIALGKPAKVSNVSLFNYVGGLPSSPSKHWDCVTILSVSVEIPTIQYLAFHLRFLTEQEKRQLSQGLVQSLEACRYKQRLQYTLEATCVPTRAHARR